MSSPFCVYDLAGNIRYTGTLRDINIPHLALKEGESVIRAKGDYGINYVDLSGEPEIKLRADYEWDSLPMPCTITIEDSTYELTEQPTLIFDEPGTYDVTVVAGAKYLKKTFQVEQL